MKRSKMCDFWKDFECFVGQDIPCAVVQILKSTGYDNSAALAGIDDKEIKSIEEYVNKNLQSLAEKYTTVKPFAFLPGHRKLLITLGKKAEMYKPLVKPSIHKKNQSFLMKELIESDQQNGNRASTARRYSNKLKEFSSYIYMMGGKASYEILSANLSLPQAATVCEYTFYIVK